MVEAKTQSRYVVIAWPERIEMDRAQAFGNPAPRFREHLTFVAQGPSGSRAEGFVVLSCTNRKQRDGLCIRGVRIAPDSGEPGAILGANKVLVSARDTFAVLPFNPSSICDTEAEVRAMMEIPDMRRAREEPKTPFPEPKTWEDVITVTSPTGETSRAERLYGDGSFGLMISDPSPPMPSKAWMERLSKIEPPQEPEPTWLEEDLVPPITSQAYMEKFNKKR